LIMGVAGCSMFDRSCTRRDLIVGAAGASLTLGRAWAQPSDLTELTIAQASPLIRSGTISPVELARAYLERIERLDPRLNAFITVTEELAYEQARERELEISRGRWRGPLHGIPVALKDNIDTAGIPSTAGSALFADRIPDEDAEVVVRLREAGAVLLGKLNMHEFAYGATSAVSHFGPVHNPWDPNRVPGGSSGGSAASVAARLCAGAVGTDTGGSIRQPAAYCGIVGLKPSYGLVSIRGIVPLSVSLDHAGPMCRTVADTAIMLQALAGYDPRDLASVEAEVPTYTGALLQRISQLRLGVPRALFFEALDEDISDAAEHALSVLTGLTASVRDVDLPMTAIRVVPVEAYAYHAEYLQREETRNLYQPPVLRRLMTGADVTATAYVEARNELARMRREIADVFSEVDLLVTPTSPEPPITIEEGRNPPDTIAFSLRNTSPFNAYGIPTISVPCGFTRQGLPIGIQISGPGFGELAVLALAHAYEQATDWRERRPPLA